MPLYNQTTNTNSPNVSNLLATNTPKWRSAKARVMAGSSTAKILMIGDSTTYGYGAVGGGQSTAITAANFPTRMGQRLTTLGVNSVNSSWFGAGAASPNDRVGGDSRLTIGGGTSYNGSVYTCGGSFYTIPGSGTMAFAPSQTVDTFVIYYATYPGNGTFSWKFNSGTATQINTSAAGGVTKAIVTGTLGANTLNLTGVSGNSLIMGIDAYNSTAPAVLVSNAGWFGSSSVAWNQTSGANWDAPYTIQNLIKPDLTIIDLGINDWNGAVAISTYTANIQALITAAISNGDVILKTPVPSNPTGHASIASQQQYVSALYALSASNNIPVIDAYARWQSYGVSNPSPLSLYYDDLHPNATGYADEGPWIAELVAGV